MTVPQHVSIIMDGNGRWAQAHGLERVKGHIEGVKRVREIVEECADRGIKYLSLYTFSEENWNRPAGEVDALMALLRQSVEGEYENMMRHGVRFIALGNRKRLPKMLDFAISQLENATSKNDRITMIVMLSYSGQWDILQAAKQLAGVPEDEITPELFASKLVTSGIPDPELVIRTSGEKRISNYMLWQTAYSEFVFTDTLWPDFRKEQFRDALEEFASRDRRFGKVK